MKDYNSAEGFCPERDDYPYIYSSRSESSPEVHDYLQSILNYVVRNAFRRCRDHASVSPLSRSLVDPLC